MNKSSLALVAIAAFMGGSFAQHLWTQPVQAASNVPNATADVIKAQSFAVVDQLGKTVGVFRAKDGMIVLYDAAGKEIWHPGVQPRPLAMDK